MSLAQSSKTAKNTPQPPDLNPIEHLWGLSEKRIRLHVTTNKEALGSAMRAEWTLITTEETERLVNSMSKRLREVLKYRAYPTKY